MWMSWIRANWKIAGAFAILLIVALSGVADGWSARNAARRYFTLAKGWAAAYQRDTAASKKEYENKINALTLERNAYRKKYEAAKGKMGAAWTPPANAKDLQERFNRIGYRGRVK